MIHFWNWLLDFTGVNNGDNSFATHMYNFWSGFGSDLTEFALLGALVALYQRHIKTSRVFNSHLIDIIHKKDEPKD